MSNRRKNARGRSGFWILPKGVNGLMISFPLSLHLAQIMPLFPDQAESLRTLKKTKKSTLLRAHQFLKIDLDVPLHQTTVIGETISLHHVRVCFLNGGRQC